MADLIETDEWPEGVYQIEQTDPVLGGAPNIASGAGLVNIPHLQLARRTLWLKSRVEALLAGLVAATTSVAGVVQLNTSVSSGSTTEAATPSAVKAANDNANGRVIATRSVMTAGLATGGGDLTGNRTITVPVAAQDDAQLGTDNTKAMTPLRTAQAIPYGMATRTAGSLGGTVILKNQTGGDLAPNDLAAGTSLRHSSIGGEVTGGAPSGTFTALSYVQAGGRGLFRRTEP